MGLFNNLFEAIWSNGLYTARLPSVAHYRVCFQPVRKEPAVQPHEYGDGDQVYSAAPELEHEGRRVFRDFKFEGLPDCGTSERRDAGGGQQAWEVDRPSNSKLSTDRREQPGQVRDEEQPHQT
eukprot:CAMPEP_0170501730 /NCGR_PEP_ID=MMETSP0208-20121228/39239_1 /TAXON_ID=197538 /ORGANISM="Strombidium inclinatum, Strain S3" /LENGTH=122 /DNA_ID=CAMNT_0010780427 /DNA_START=288 /DNA_END=655 /DNA_ORIENTATION=-